MELKSYLTNGDYQVMAPLLLEMRRRGVCPIGKLYITSNWISVYKRGIVTGNVFEVCLSTPNQPNRPTGVILLSFYPGAVTYRFLNELLRNYTKPWACLAMVAF